MIEGAAVGLGVGFIVLFAIGCGSALMDRWRSRTK